MYGANIDIRDFSGKKAFNYLKANQQEKKMEGVCLDLNVVYNVLQERIVHIQLKPIFLFIRSIFFLGKVRRRS